MYATKKERPKLANKILSTQKIEFCQYKVPSILASLKCQVSFSPEL